MTTPRRDFTAEPIRHFTFNTDPSEVRIVLGRRTGRDVSWTTRIRFPEEQPAQLVLRGGFRRSSLSNQRFRALNARTV